MNLKHLFRNAPDAVIEQLSIDSRIPMRNAIFFCLEGIKYDGHNFIDEAIDNGATVIVYSKSIETHKKAIYIKVNNVSDSLFKIADAFYSYPNKGLDEYVVSGCYGRSSVTNIIKYYLDKKSNCGYIGIQGIKYKQTNLSLPFETLSPLDNLKYLSKMKQEDIHNCVFESSPINLYFKKLDVLKPKVFVYTNTSKFCGDYKSCGTNYFDYLRKYLYTLEENTCVVLNGDDISYYELKDSAANYVTYGTGNDCVYRINNIQYRNDSTKFEINYDGNVYWFETKLLGQANVYNLAAAIAALNANGYNLIDISNELKHLEYIPGVMERVNDTYNIIVDCAFEPDSIENCFKFVKDITTGKKIGIIGINYSDDDARLKKILKYADEYLDVLYVTEDESQDAAVMDILKRLDKFEHKCKIVKAIYRSIAIELAVEIMDRNDTLIILGKGDESYMNMGLGKEFYSGDKNFVVKYLKKRMDEENEIVEIY